MLDASKLCKAYLTILKYGFGSLTMDSNGPSGHEGQVQGPYSDLAYSVDGPSDLRPRRNSQGSGSGSRAGSPKSATSKEDQARDKQDKKDSEAQLKKYYSQELDDFRTKDVSKRLDLPPEAYVRVSSPGQIYWWITTYKHP
jgi:hypothetical protein